MMQRIMRRLTVLVMVMFTCSPVWAEYAGTLQRDQPFTVSITSASTDTVAVTVYYLDNRGTANIEFMSVSESGVQVQQEFPRPGKGVRRVIIEVDPPSGGTASLRIDQFPPVNVDGSVRIVFDVP